MFDVVNFTSNAASVSLEGSILLSAEPVLEDWSCLAFTGVNPIRVRVNEQRNGAGICSGKKRIDGKTNLVLGKR